MKTGKRTEPGSKPLARRQLRALERQLGVFFDKPKDGSRSAEQQFGVYDEDETHVGDICAANFFFTEEELRAAVLKLFGKDKAEREYLTFGELATSDQFISLPQPGDNSGHGGFRRPFYIFIKTVKNKDGNAIRVKDGSPSHMPDTMPIIKVE